MFCFCTVLCTHKSSHFTSLAQLVRNSFFPLSVQQNPCSSQDAHDLLQVDFMQVTGFCFLGQCKPSLFSLSSLYKHMDLVCTVTCLLVLLHTCFTALDNRYLLYRCLLAQFKSFYPKLSVYTVMGKRRTEAQRVCSLYSTFFTSSSSAAAYGQNIHMISKTKNK